MTKRFEVAIEISKQMITLCSALIIGTAALAANILSNEESRVIFTMLVFQYIFHFLSIIFGVFHIGAMANLIETAERVEYEREMGSNNRSPTFVSIFDNRLAPIFCSIQQWLFVLGVLFLVATVIADWNMR